MRLAYTLLLVPLFSIVLPSPAQACSPEPCYYSDKWQEFDLASPVVATEGVLLIDARRGPASALLTDAEALEFLTAEVTADGVPVTGSFELDPTYPGLVWRPDQPFAANAALSLSLSVDNDSIPDDGCEADPALGPFLAEVSPDELPGFGDIPSSSSYALSLTPTVGLETLICCDGAYPVLEEMCGFELTWNEGHCEPTEGVGRVEATWALDLLAMPEQLRGNISWRVISDAGQPKAWPGQTELHVNRDQPLCGHIELVNRATGEAATLPEACFGMDDLDALGILEIDPSEGLEGSCAGEPYICDVLETGWDPEACEGIGGDGDGDGDGDAGDGDGDAGDGDGDTESGDGDGDTESGDGDGDPSSGTEGGEETGDPGADGGPDLDSGCACSADAQPATPAAGFALLMVLGFVRRKRA